jgi:hypothetical protein
MDGFSLLPSSSGKKGGDAYSVASDGPSCSRFGNFFDQLSDCQVLEMNALYSLIMCFTGH